NFAVLTAASRSGQFTTEQYPAPGGTGRAFKPIYDPTVAVTPSPFTGLLLQTQVLPPVNFGYATTQGSPATTAGEGVTPNGIVLDAAGNTYVHGIFTGTADFDREHAVGGDT